MQYAAFWTVFFSKKVSIYSSKNDVLRISIIFILGENCFALFVKEWFKNDWKKKYLHYFSDTHQGLSLFPAHRRGTRTGYYKWTFLKSSTNIWPSFLLRRGLTSTNSAVKTVNGLFASFLRFWIISVTVSVWNGFLSCQSIETSRSSWKTFFTCLVCNLSNKAHSNHWVKLLANCSGMF